MKKHLVGSILTSTILFTLTSVWILALNTAIIGQKAIDFVLEDQFEAEHAWQKYSGKDVLLMMADRSASEYTKNWTNALEPAYKGKIEFVPVADVSSVPGFLKGFIRSKFRDAYTYPILLDWDGQLIEHYQCKSDIPTLVYIDKLGIVRLHIAGKGSADDITTLRKTIDKWLK
jgi:peroxiredoxin